MLVLSRKRNESIVVGDGEIEIVVVDIRGDKVRLGITADQKWTIHRREIFNAIKSGEEEENRRITPPASPAITDGTCGDEA